MNSKILFTTLTILVVAAVSLVFVRDFKNRRDAKTIYVGPTRVLCLSNRLQRCYQVKENKDDDYKLFNGTIRNFVYQPGYEYELMVDEVTVENITNNQKFVTYDLYKEVNKEEVPYVLTVTPADGQTLPINRAFTVAGKARGVYEGNIVVEAKDLRGNVLARTTTTMPTDKPGEESVWQAQLSVNAKPGTRALIVAYSPSPADENETMKPEENKDQNAEDADANTQDQQTAKIQPMSYSTIVVFDPNAKAVAVRSPLENTSWLLTAYKAPNGTETVNVSKNTPVTASFVQGKVSGTSACNNYQANYQVQNDSIRIGQIASTRKSCEDNVNKLEKDYQVNLQSAAYYQVQPTALVLYNSQRVPLLQFTRVINRNQQQDTNAPQDKNTDTEKDTKEEMNKEKMDNEETQNNTEENTNEQNTNNQEANTEETPAE